MKSKSFSDLALLKKLWQRQAQERAAQREAYVRHQIQKQADHDLFARTIGPVEPIKKVSRVIHEPLEPIPPLPLQRQKDEAQVLADSISDEFDVESLLETDDGLFYAGQGIGIDVVRKLRRGAWVIEAQIDLHGLRRDQARNELNFFLRQAMALGQRCVRVIHGKGNGSPGRESILKAKSKSWLAQKKEVLAFTQARASEGGQGALIVLLAPKSRKQ